MKTAFEIAAELHEELNHIGFHEFGGCRQDISNHRLGIGAYNQPAHQIVFTTYIPPERFELDDPRHKAFCGGFNCVVIAIYVVWGGRHHDETPITEPEIQFSIHDRTGGGMATRNWTYNGNWGEKLEFADIIPVARAVLTEANSAQE
jgi:hypothetical protein